MRSASSATGSGQGRVAQEHVARLDAADVGLGFEDVEAAFELLDFWVKSVMVPGLS
jgi:hypothetical protein